MFDGFVETPGGNKQPLDINNLLLRGSVLRKTEWVIGLALNVGSDSKIVQNMTKAPRKVGQMTSDMGYHWATCAYIPSTCFSHIATGAGVAPL